MALRDRLKEAGLLKPETELDYETENLLHALQASLAEMQRILFSAAMSGDLNNEKRRKFRMAAADIASRTQHKDQD